MRKAIVFLAMFALLVLGVTVDAKAETVVGGVYQKLEVTSHTEGEISAREDIYVTFNNDIILLNKEKIAANSLGGTIKPQDVTVDGNKLRVSFVQKTDDVVKVDGVVLKRYIAALRGGTSYNIAVDAGAVADKNKVSIINDSLSFPIKTKTALYLGKSVPDGDNVSRLSDVEIYIQWQAGYKSSSSFLSTERSDYYLRGDKTGDISIVPALTNPLTDDGFWIRFSNTKPLPAGEKITAGIKPHDDTSDYLAFLYQNDVAAKIRWDEEHYMPPVEFSFKTAETDDVTPPAPPQNITAALSEGKIVLSWDNPPSEDFAGVEILRSNDDLSKRVNLFAYVPAPANSYDITVDKDIGYCFLFRSVDKNGNKSELKWISGYGYDDTYGVGYRPAHKITPKAAVASNGHKILVSWDYVSDRQYQNQTVLVAAYGTNTWQQKKLKTFWNRAPVVKINEGRVGGMLTDLPPGKYVIRIDDKGYFEFSHNGKEIARQEWVVSGDPVDNGGQGFEVKPPGAVNKRFGGIAFGFWDGLGRWGIPNSGDIDRSPRFGKWETDAPPTMTSSPEWLEQYNDLYDRLYAELTNNPLTAAPLGYEWWCNAPAVFILKVDNADRKVEEIKEIYINNKTTGKTVVLLDRIANIGDRYSDNHDGIRGYLAEGGGPLGPFQAIYDKDAALLISSVVSSDANWSSNWRFYGGLNSQYKVEQVLPGKLFSACKQTGWAVGDNLLEYHVVWQDAGGMEHDDAVAEDVKQVGTQKRGFACFPVKYSVRMSDQRNDPFLEFDAVKDRWSLGWQGDRQEFPKPRGEAKLNSSPTAGKVAYGKAYVAVPTWRGATPWHCPYPPGHPEAPPKDQDFSAVFASSNPKLVITHKVNGVQKESISGQLTRTTLHLDDPVLEAKVTYRIFSADFQVTLESGKNEFVFDIAAETDRVPDYTPEYLAPELPGSINLAPYADEK